jgi:hypothetical protein
MKFGVFDLMDRAAVPLGGQYQQRPQLIAESRRSLDLFAQTIMPVPARPATQG